MNLSSNSINLPSLITNEDNILYSLQIPPLIFFDFNKAIPVLSPDNSFAIFYNQSLMLHVDLKTKLLKSYQSFLPNEQISNVQINSQNQITFIKKTESFNIIVSLSPKNFMDYDELKINDNILAYKLFQNQEYNDMLIVVNEKYQITLYKDNILLNNISKNVFNDLPANLLGNKNKLLTIEYLYEQKLILFFFDNGIVAVYSLHNNNPENIYENDEILEYETYLNLNQNEKKPNIYYNYIIKRNLYICENNIEENNDMEVEINSNNDNNKIITTYLTICVNQKFLQNKQSSIYFYKIENGKFIKFNKNDDDSESDVDININNENNNIILNNDSSNIDIKKKKSFENKEIMDCFIFKYKNKNDENDTADHIFLLFKNFDRGHNPNKYVYSIEYANLFNLLDLNKNSNEEGSFNEINVFEELPNSYLYINYVILSEKKQKIFNIYLNIFYFLSINECKIGKKILVTNSINANNLDDHNSYNLLDSNNYNDYVRRYNEINYNDNQFIGSVIKKFKDIYKIDLNDNNDLNHILINLISNQAMFKIRTYLMKKNTLNNEYIFPIDKTIFTCKYILDSIKNELKAGYIMDNSDQQNKEIEILFSILINILKILLNRNKIYSGNLFDKEKEILLEQDAKINYLIFECECLLFIIKIQNLFNKNRHSNELKTGNVLYNILSFNIMDFIQNDDQFVLNTDSLENNYHLIRENIENLHLKYMELFTNKNISNLFSQKNEFPVTLTAMLYYFKFIIFNYYFYYIFPIISNNINDFNNSNNIENYFKGVIPEMKNYFEISKTIFILENTPSNKIFNTGINPLVNLLQYISKENLIKNKEINEIISINKNIYWIMKCLYEKKFYREAFIIGSSILSYLSTFDEFNIYLKILLALKEYPTAYSFINNVVLLSYDANQQNRDSFFKSKEYLEIKNIYFIFFDYLIKNRAIDLLFKLPLNYIEIYIFKEICKENEKYEEFLIIYYLKIGKLNEAKNYFEKYKNTTNGKISSSKEIYENLINYYETFSNKNINKSKNNLGNEKFLIRVKPIEEKIIDLPIEVGKNPDQGFSEALLQNSIMESKLVSGMNMDNKEIPEKLIGQLNSYNKNLSMEYLSKENLKKINRMRELSPFSKDLSSIKKRNDFSNDGNFSIFK